MEWSRAGCKARCSAPKQAVARAVDLCLVVPPFALADKPALGPGILAAACQERGLSVRTVYANLLLAGRIGLDDYGWMASSPRHI